MCFSAQCTCDSGEDSPNSFHGYNTSFGFQDTLLARVASVTGESQYPVYAGLKRRECGSGGHSQSEGRSLATP